MNSSITQPHIPRKLNQCTWIKEKDKFFFFDSEQPFLVLYAMANKSYRTDLHGESESFQKMPAFVNPENWVSLMHQTAGYACHSYYIHAMFLAPTKKIREGLYQDILEKYNDSCIGRIARLKTAVEYEKLLNKYDLSANESYEYLEEGFYPIDIDCIKKVTKDKIPNNLQELIQKPKKKEKLWSFLNYVHFGLAILGPNCD